MNKVVQLAPCIAAAAAMTIVGIVYGGVALPASAVGLAALSGFAKQASP